MKLVVHLSGNRGIWSTLGVPAMATSSPVLCKDEKWLSYSLGWEGASPTKVGAIERCGTNGNWEQVVQPK
jgi:hypothetical protein